MPGMPAGFASGPPPGGSISPSQLASQAAYTVLGNNTAGTASPTAVAPSAWPATTSAAGFMSAADKTKTDRYSYGAGSPEGVVTATVGCTYQDTTNGWIWQKLSGTGNTGWKVTGYSGTYTATCTAITNLDAVSAVGTLRYMRVGDTVFVGGAVNIDPTDSGSVTFDASLPIASAFTSADDASGQVNTQHLSGMIYAETTNDRVRCVLAWNASTGEYAVRVSFSYVVI